MSDVLMKLAKSIAKQKIKIIDLTQTLRPSTPVIQLPPPFAPTEALLRSRRSRITTTGARPGTGTTSPAASTPARISTLRSIGSPARITRRRDRHCRVQRFVAPAVVIDCSQGSRQDERFPADAASISRPGKRSTAEIPDGSWVLMRTDWSKRDDPAKFLNMKEDGPHVPGPHRRRGAFPGRRARRDRMGSRGGRHGRRPGLRVRSALSVPHAHARHQQFGLASLRISTSCRRTARS